jgi:NADH-quinone oxidoreductase subunit L
MTVALGASAYAAGIFHLATHAFFKALLFLGAGSVIIAMHHQQDMRHMGGLWKYLKITYFTTLIGAIASAGFPPFAGFFSKDSIIEAAHLSKLPGSGFAYFCVLACVFVTAFYTFRLVFMTFHGEERFRNGHGKEDHGHGAPAHESHGAGAAPHAGAAASGVTSPGGAPVPPSGGHAPHESPAVVTVPLILLAIPSICAGWVIGPVLFGGYFGSAIVVAPAHDVLALLGKDFHGVLGMMAHGLTTPPLWLAVAGLVTAWYLYLVRPDLPGAIQKRFKLIYTVLDRKYWFDEFNDWFFSGGARLVGGGLWKGGDVAVIDGIVNGSARAVGWVALLARALQSGFIYHYAFGMIIGVLVLLTMISLWLFL